MRHVVGTVAVVSAGLLGFLAGYRLDWAWRKPRTGAEGGEAHAARAA